MASMNRGIHSRTLIHNLLVIGTMLCAATLVACQSAAVDSPASTIQRVSPGPNRLSGSAAVLRALAARGRAARAIRPGHDNFVRLFDSTGAVIAELSMINGHVVRRASTLPSAVAQMPLASFTAAGPAMYHPVLTAAINQSGYVGSQYVADRDSAAADTATGQSASVITGSVDTLNNSANLDFSTPSEAANIAYLTDIDVYIPYIDHTTNTLNYMEAEISGSDIADAITDVEVAASKLVAPTRAGSSALRTETQSLSSAMSKSIKPSQVGSKLTPSPLQLEAEVVAGGCDEAYAELRRQAAKTVTAGFWAVAAQWIPGADAIATGYFLGNVMDLAYDEFAYDTCLLNSIFAEVRGVRPRHAEE